MNRPKKNRNGALAVEMALCLPILLTLLFASYEAARANMLRHATESAAYEGARVGIIPGATPKKIKAAAGLVLHSVGVSNFRVSVSPRVIKKDTSHVEVTITVPFATNTSIPSFFVKNPVFRGACKLTRERP